jgi:hypothetical protein
MPFIYKTTRGHDLLLTFADVMTSIPATGLLLMACSVSADPVLLEASQFEHIPFDRIAPAKYTFTNNTLVIDVNKNASFVLQPFKSIIKVSAVSFDWKSTGTLDVKSREMEASREGDDFYLRIGLMVEGKADSINPFSPAWIKKVKNLLQHPSNRLIDIVTGAKHAAGETWQSPYDSSVTMIAAKSSGIGNGWSHAEHHLDATVEVVGLWIMADGDNTGSAFTTRIKNLELH